ncbi:uncharacterized protein LOC100876696 isoform X2 [Megachile rotundata]|nr:PREDICTED: uncharacterized protein LOC100876696 isoform X2 [Megachile rotundata]XP_012145306.1 PREDICTED: uncharacterized protein LOC100876696 isoform X2 [Megachile rotundata]
MLGLGKYFYYAKPDGEDLMGKILTSVRMTSMFGIVVGAHDAILRHMSKSPLHKIVIGFRPVAYLSGIGFVFANVTYMSTRMRGKDDALNHGIGALATAPLVKAWLRIPAVEVAEIMIFGTIIMIINKARRKQEYGIEEPLKFFFEGKRNKFPNWDYWEYWTGEETPAEDYTN